MTQRDADDFYIPDRQATKFQSPQDPAPRDDWTAVQVPKILIRHAAKIARARGVYRDNVVSHVLRLGWETAAERGLYPPLPVEAVEAAQQVEETDNAV